MSLREPEDEMTPSIWGNSSEYWDYGKRGGSTDEASETKSNSWDAMPNLSILEQLSQEMTCKGPQQAEVQLRYVHLLTAQLAETRTSQFCSFQVHVANVSRRWVFGMVLACGCVAKGRNGSFENVERSSGRNSFSRNTRAAPTRPEGSGKLDRQSMVKIVFCLMPYWSSCVDANILELFRCCMYFSHTSRWRKQFMKSGVTTVSHL